MAQNRNYTIQPLTDSSLVISFGNTMDRETHGSVLAAYHTLKAKNLLFITDLVPAYSSLGIIYSLEKASMLPGTGSIYSRIAPVLREILTITDKRKQEEKRQLRVPVCYDKDFAPDLEELAEWAGLTIREVIGLHCSTVYDVYLLGFLPGFAYMGVVDERIAMPRRSTPRTLVPKGSVGIAGKQTGIYPFDSPGGWQLIGRTPLELFNPVEDQLSYFLPGDEVSFYPITKNEFENY